MTNMNMNEMIDATMETVAISNGNSKLGVIRSVSLPAITTCRKNAPCGRLCYTQSGPMSWKRATDSYSKNYRIYMTDPDRYFEEIAWAVRIVACFRFHVSGDIPSADYFRRMVNLASENRHCKFLVPTKQYEIVNDVVDEIGRENLPENLLIRFSKWFDYPMDNRHNFPVMAVFWADIEEKDIVCGGNCSECLCRGTGCWTLADGQTIWLPMHGQRANKVMRDRNK